MRHETIIIPGRPQGKGRPRFTRDGHAYTPPSTRLYEELIRKSWENRQSFEGPIEIWIDAYLQIPGNLTKSEKALIKHGDVKPTKKPDIDNIVKAVLDGLNGLAYEDDRQVVVLHAAKHYGETPCVEVFIEESQ